MANKEFKSIEDFIEGFTRTGPTTDNFKYDGIIFGIEFSYKNKIFRITRDAIGNEKALQEMFNKTSRAFIKFFEIPIKQYPNACVDDLSMYYGIFDDVNDLLDNGKIEGLPLKSIIAGEDTTILAID